MPKGNGLGPNGMGAMSGRSAGFCAGYDRPGYANLDMGRSFSRGRRCGFGMRAGVSYGQRVPYVAPRYSANEEAAFLKNQVTALEEELAASKKRLDELETSS